MRQLFSDIRQQETQDYKPFRETKSMSWASQFSESLSGENFLTVTWRAGIEAECGGPAELRGQRSQFRAPVESLGQNSTFVGQMYGGT